jgi:FKBP-type peptidyl-prolyl cis-trans isomerase FklB
MSERRSCALDARAFATSVPGFGRSAEVNLMKSSLICISLVVVAASLFAEDQPALKDTKDKVSYSFGLNVGFNLQRQKMDLNPDAFMAGLKDALSGKQPQLTEEQVREVMTQFQKDMDEKQKTAAQKNQTDGEKFLAENKNKPGVKTTASGLQYKVLKEGNGATPKPTDTVVVNYRGTLLDGTEFDSSYKRGQPATFPVNQVIKGWTEALQLMKAGSKYQLFIPADLAYGARGAGGEIGPNSTLIFEVELLDVKPSASASPSPSASASSSPSASASSSP